MAPKNQKKRKSQPMELYLVTMGHKNKPSVFPRTVGIYSTWELAIESARIAFYEETSEEFFNSEEFIQDDFHVKFTTEECDGGAFNEPIVLYDKNMYYRYKGSVKKQGGDTTDVMIFMEKLRMDE